MIPVNKVIRKQKKINEHSTETVLVMMLALLPAIGIEGMTNIGPSSMELGG
jgi:hypothetical protein